MLFLVALVYKPPITYPYEDVCCIEINYMDDGNWNCIELDEKDRQTVYDAIKYSPYARVDRFVDDDCGPDSKWIVCITLKAGAHDKYYWWNRGEVVKNICDEDGYVKERIYIRDKSLINIVEGLIISQ